MTEYWWKDLFDRNNNWQGLEFTIRAHQGVAQAMDMLSADESPNDFGKNH
ncbi:hypothetical protein NO595_004721 [Escherichia coli]|nr:hypothetical protein [Escherichia coli]